MKMSKKTKRIERPALAAVAEKFVSELHQNVPADDLSVQRVPRRCLRSDRQAVNYHESPGWPAAPAVPARRS
jgi:hypothetical protein